MPAPPETLRFEPGADVPNHPRWPVLLYRSAVGGGADAVAERLAQNGWGGAWVGGVFPYTHYHPNAHEALAVVAGTATVRLGGAAGQDVDLRPGDVAVLPAGTGHRRIDASAGFRVVGAYPEGQHVFETRRPDRDAPTPPEAVGAVPRPTADPVRGRGGPLLALWP